METQQTATKPISDRHRFYKALVAAAADPSPGTFRDKLRKHAKITGCGPLEIDKLVKDYDSKVAEFNAISGITSAAPALVTTAAPAAPSSPPPAPSAPSRPSGTPW